MNKTFTTVTINTGDNMIVWSVDRASWTRIREKSHLKTVIPLIDSVTAHSSDASHLRTPVSDHDVNS